MPSFGVATSPFRKKTGANSNPTKKKSSTGSTRERGGSTGTQTVRSTPRSYAPAQYVSPAGQMSPGDTTPWRTTPGSPIATGSPGGTGGTGLPTNGTNPFTGAAADFNPTLQESVWRDPQLVLNHMFTQKGWDTSSPAYSVLRDFYGADPQSLWLLTQGNTPGNFRDAGDYANFLNSVYTNQMTPGGRSFDFNEILGTLNGVGDQSQLSAQDQSPLWQLLTSGGPAEQVRSLYGLLGDAARVGLSPAMASAFMDALARQSDSYLSQSATSQGPVDPYYQWWQDPMLGR